MTDNTEPGTTDSRALLTRGRQALVQAGVGEALLEARLLLAHAMGIESAALLLEPDRAVSASAAQAFEVILARRAGREPLAYITGSRDFYGLRFDVDPRALIPRPETELLVDEAIAVVRAWGDRRRRPSTIADVGTGSGAIIVALAVALADTDARFHATDLSAGAIELARANADRHGVGERISFHVGDLLRPLPTPVDLIIANPPYVPAENVATIQPEIRLHEPRMAIDGGSEDGLSIVRRLLAMAPGVLSSGGALLMEMGYGQATDVVDTARAAFADSSTMIDVVPDLAGIPRVLRIFRDPADSHPPHFARTATAP